MSLVSERVGQFFHEGHRLEYTEYGGGDDWVVLLHGQLMPRRMHEPLARYLAADGAHVITLDLLGHGRSDRPDDPLLYSMTAFGEQVVGAARRARHPRSGGRGHVAGRQRLARGGHAGARAGARRDRRDAGARQRAGGRHPRLRAAAVRLAVPPDRDLRAARGDPAGTARRRTVLGRDRPGHHGPAAQADGRRDPRHLLRQDRAVLEPAPADHRPGAGGRPSRATRSTRPRTRRCSPRSSRTRGSWRPRTSGSGASGRAA